jgi:hypothetical protein
MDLATLLSPAVRRKVEALDIRLVTFPQVALQQGPAVLCQADSGLQRG